jgi:hypothetical protein
MALNAFTEAWTLAQKIEKVTNPVRLGVANNYAVFLRDIMDRKDESLKIAQTEHDAAFRI